MPIRATNNLWKTITFDVENITLSRRLVPRPRNLETEINAAQPGHSFTAHSPGGPITVRVKSIVA